MAKRKKRSKRPAAKKAGGRKQVAKKATKPKSRKRGVSRASKAAQAAPAKPAVGDWAWHELMTPDSASAKSFYTSLFGWATSEMDMGGRTYTLFHHKGQPHGGMMAMSGPEWQGVPPHWMVYVNVNDVDATAARAAQLGGRVCVPPTDIPVGRFAVLNDPHGAAISIYKPAAM